MKKLSLLLFLLFSLSTFAQKADKIKKEVEAEKKKVEREDMRAILKEVITFKKERKFPILKVAIDSIKIDSSLVDLHDLSVIPVSDTFSSVTIDSIKMFSVIDSFFKVTKFIREDHETEKMIVVKVTKERKEVLENFFFAEKLSLEEREIVHAFGLEIHYIKLFYEDVVELEKSFLEKQKEILDIEKETERTSQEIIDLEKEIIDLSKEVLEQKKQILQQKKEAERAWKVESEKKKKELLEKQKEAERAWKVEVEVKYETMFDF